MNAKENLVGQYDYIIIGAGPAGLQLSYFLEKTGRNYLVLEAGDAPGTSFKEFPRHRTLISINKVYTGYDDMETNLRWDWNALLSDQEDLLFKYYSHDYFPDADALVKYLHDYAGRFNLNIKYGVKVTKINKPDTFRVTDEQGNIYSCKRLIVATGFAKPYIPDIPGFELTENYVDVSIDPNDFINQKVLVIGKGNSAFETADNLIQTASVIHVLSPSPLTLAWKSHYVGHLRAVNNNFLDTYQLKSQNAVLDASIEKIERRQDGKYVVSVSYTHAHGETEELLYDRVISCTGFRFDPSIFDDTCQPALAINNRYPAQTSQWESTNIEGLYFAGVLMQMRDLKKATSGFIHGFRYNIRILYNILENKYHNTSWSFSEVEMTTESLVTAILERVNQTSALWQQFGFLCDVIVVSGDKAKYYQELPIDYVRESEFGQHDDYYQVTLEFGKITGDPFNIERNPVPHKAPESTFLHPVVRHFRGSELIGEKHLLEDLDAEWRNEKQHIQPLKEFFDVEIAKTSELQAVGAQ